MSLYENVQNKRKRDGLEGNDEEEEGGERPDEPLSLKIEELSMYLGYKKFFRLER